MSELNRKNLLKPYGHSTHSYAIYLTLLRRMTDDTLNLPMFFGFVGMFIMLMFWPGLGKMPIPSFL